MRLLQRDKEERAKNEKLKRVDKKEKAENKKTADKESVKGTGKTTRKVEGTKGDKAELPKTLVNPPTPVKAVDEESETSDGGRRRSRRVAKAKENADKVDNEVEQDKTAERREGKGKKKLPKKKVKEEEEEEEEEKEEETKEDVNGDVNGKEEDSGQLTIAHAAELEQKAWKPIYLTMTEVEGLLQLIDKLQTWPVAKKCVPSMITDPEGLLEQLQVGETRGCSSTKRWNYKRVLKCRPQTPSAWSERAWRLGMSLRKQLSY